MKFFIIEGLIKNPTLINENILNEHIAYSKKEFESGRILVTGLKNDESGGIFLMKAESMEQVEKYLSAEPLKTNDIQDYRVIEFTPHNFQLIANEWFEKQ
ncbi:Uncharacterized conserved protein YciI, contains a putative active-site phosphohistidine [Clostridium cavendishii DSM 21758]|uniref:Uncharacterized conserved protein YciI, contains a putative active-site phosphohistidine n=1 Tax=Clostridium cavendishii DSM 21758 TaxID=1121302 RepID=A0A1M6NHT4_9CLOT|nr:YciI family protein [Clostridium cavendishii]SHJ95250.1 Uncharacterized conserved protein YciI, contains a putative active-site phosphohistidine [Clostridium cavendishii DSM 21758]